MGLDEIWWELDWAVESRIAITDILAKLKYGGSVCEKEKLANF